MLWFLRLFSHYRELEALTAMQARTVEECDRNAVRMQELVVDNESLRHDVTSLQESNQDLIHEKSLLEDRLASAIQDKDRLWETTQTALQGERYAYQTMVNHAVQKNGGGIPFGDAHALPPNEVRKVQVPGPIGRSARSLPSEGAMRASNAFVKSYMETLGPDAKVV